MDGTVHPDFCDVAASLRTQLERCEGGGAVCVHHHGEIVVDLWGGARDETGTPWARDTMAPSFSTTKGAASTVLHILVDRGLLDYDDRVSKHWPEFAQAGKQDITVRHILAHQSGLYHLRQMVDHAERMLDWQYMVHAIERTRPAHAPGERTGYHGLSFGFLVGEIIQRVTGKSFSQAVEDELVKPLDLDGMYIGAPEHVLHRAARLLPSQGGWQLQATDRVHGPAMCIEKTLRRVGVPIDLSGLVDLMPRGIGAMDFSANETLKVAMPSMNGLFTARALSRMYAALALGGEIDGARLLSQRTLRRATKLQPRPRNAFVWPIDMRWRLGYHRVFTTRGSPEQAFGHFGFGGSGAWADPERKLSLAMIVNSGSGTPFGDTRIARISHETLAAADARA